MKQDTTDENAGRPEPAVPPPAGVSRALCLCRVPPPAPALQGLMFPSAKQVILFPLWFGGSAASRPCGDTGSIPGPAVG